MPLVSSHEFLVSSKLRDNHNKCINYITLYFIFKVRYLNDVNINSSQQ